MSLEIKKEDVVKLILQYLRDNHYLKSFTTLSDESQVTLNIIDDLDSFKLDIEQGRWDKVLRDVSRMRLQNQKLMNLYEIIICELLEANEREVALIILNEALREQDLHLIYKERYLRLDYLIRKPGDVDLLQLYNDNYTKEERRNLLAKNILEDLVTPPPSRLLNLLGNALRFQYQNKDISQLDVFLGTFPEIKDQQDRIISKIAKIVKYTEQLRIETATFSHDGQHLVTGSIDGIIEVWDPIQYKVRTDLTFQAQDQFMSHKDTIIDLQFSQDDELLASSDKNIVRIWKLQTGKCLKKIDNTHSRLLHSILFANDPQDILIASEEIHAFNLRSSTVIKVFRGHTSSVNKMCQSQSGAQLFSCSDDGTVRIWDYQSLECLFQFKPNQQCLRVQNIFKGIQDKKTFLICSQSNVLILVNAAMNVTKTYKIPSEIEAEFIWSGFSAQGNYVYGLTSSSLLLCYDQASGQLIKQIQLPQGCKEIQLHPKQNLAFSFNGKGELIFLKV